MAGGALELLAISPFITFLGLGRAVTVRAGILNFQIISWHRLSEAISAQGRD